MKTKTRGIRTLLAAVIIFTVSCAITFIYGMFFDSLTDFLWIQILLLILADIVPLLVYKRIMRESWELYGFTKQNVAWSVIIGIVVSAAFIVINFYGGTDGVRPKPMTELIIWLFFYMHVAFYEEMLFRGLLQGALIDWLGTWKGITLTVVVCTLFHFPNQFISGGFTVQAATSYFISLLPIGFFFGFLTYKLKNIYFGLIIHTSINYVHFLIDR